MEFSVDLRTEMLSRELFLVSRKCSPHTHLRLLLRSFISLGLCGTILFKLLFGTGFLPAFSPGTTRSLNPDPILIFLGPLSQLSLPQSVKLLSWAPSTFPWDIRFVRTEGNVLDLDIALQDFAPFTLQFCLSTEPENPPAPPLL